LVLSTFFPTQMQISIILLGFGFCLFSFFNFISSYLRGIEEMHYEAMLLIIQRGSLLALVGCVFLISKTSFSTAVAFFFSMVLSLVFAIFIFRKFSTLNVRDYTGFKMKRLWPVIKDVYPLALAGCLWSVYYRIDNVMITMFKNLTEVGLYSAAYKLAEGIILLARVWMMVLFPRFSKLGFENISEFYIFFNTAFWVLMTLAIVIAGCMYYFSAPMLTFILGEPYAGSGSPLMVRKGLPGRPFVPTW